MWRAPAPRHAATENLQLSRYIGPESSAVAIRLSVPKLGGVISCDAIYLRRKSERVKRWGVLFIHEVVFAVVIPLTITIGFEGGDTEVRRFSVDIKKPTDDVRIP